jgi:hypothetical protein
MSERKRLSDILLNSERERLERLWQTTKPAADLKPLPAGRYKCRITNGEPFKSRNGNLGYKLTLTVVEGEHVDRLIWHDCWLTTDGAKYALRDLAKLGVESPEQLERPLPAGIIVEANVVVRRGDDGSERNQLKNSNPFDVVGIDPEKPDPFAPVEPSNDVADAACRDDDGTADVDGFDWSTGEGKGEPTP